MMADEFQYHSSELDLTGDSADHDWSIRCLDVHKRLGGIPVLNGLNVAIPDEMASLAAEYREKLLDAVVETDEDLMEAYLAGAELDPGVVADALKLAVSRDELYPVGCGVATKNLGTHALLDLLVEGMPSPDQKPLPVSSQGGTVAYVFKTVADPFAGRISCFRVYDGRVTPEATLVNLRDKAKERLGALMMLQGKDHDRA